MSKDWFTYTGGGAWPWVAFGGRSRFFESGEVRLAILSLLDEGPKHGYQVMKELEERSGGLYRASAGSIYYPTANCTASTCQLHVGFTTSTDGGTTWTAGTQIAGPMKLAWLPNSDNGPMVADYIGVSYVNGNPFGVFAVAQAPTTGGVLHESMNTTKTPLPVSSGVPRFSSVDDKPVPNFRSDHTMQFFYDDEGHRPIPQSRWIPTPAGQ